MYREFPTTTYIPQRLTIYGDTPTTTETPARSITRTSELPKTPPILEDTGIVGTEGRGVEILDVPTKKEALTELITPVALPKGESERAIARTSIEPERERITLPDDRVGSLVSSRKSESVSSMGIGDFRPVVFSDLEGVSKSSKETKSYMSDVTMDSVLKKTPVTKKESSESEKSFRFPEPTSFRYSDIERIDPSPYASERSFGEYGFSGSDSDAPTRLSGNVFKQQQADFMEKAKNVYQQKQRRTKPKTRSPWPESLGGGEITDTTQYFTDSSVIEKPVIEKPKEKPKRKPKQKRLMPEEMVSDVGFGLPPDFEMTQPLKRMSKMNKTELENQYKRITGNAPPKMSKRDLYREMMGLVNR
jgi:hypothetical protein